MYVFLRPRPVSGGKDWGCLGAARLRRYAGTRADRADGTSCALKVSTTINTQVFQLGPAQHPRHSARPEETITFVCTGNPKLSFGGACSIQFLAHGPPGWASCGPDEWPLCAPESEALAPLAESHYLRDSDFSGSQLLALCPGWCGSYSVPEVRSARRWFIGAELLGATQIRALLGRSATCRGEAPARHALELSGWSAVGVPLGFGRSAGPPHVNM